MAAILAPHVNAYKRLQPDMLNGYWANWGHDDRSVTVRVPADARRRDAARTAHVGRGREPVPGGGRDPARGPPRCGARPAAAADPTGVRAPQHRDLASRRTWTPPSTTLAADGELVDAIGREMVEAFTILKRGEWERYLASGANPDMTDVTEWELAYYLPFH